MVFLSLTAREAAVRTGLDTARPLLAADPHRCWRVLTAARRPLYEEVARAVVRTRGRTRAQVARAVLDALGRSRTPRASRPGVRLRPSLTGFLRIEEL
ncbi:shikimate kinase [Streptomyces sp. O3]